MNTLSDIQIDNQKNDQIEGSQANFWKARYQQNQTYWDMGRVSPPLKAYFDQLTDKRAKILIAGAGNAHEAGYLHELGFDNVWVLDIVEDPLLSFAQRYPDFPKDHLLNADFFSLDKPSFFDIAIEQTFFSAIDPSLREAYVRQMANLLKKSGKLVGLLFDRSFGGDQPPFGGSVLEYQKRFLPYFDLQILAPCYNSHPARLGSELFIKFVKK